MHLSKNAQDVRTEHGEQAGWLDLIRNFRKRFRVEIGLPTTLQSVSSRRRTNRTAAQA